MTEHEIKEFKDLVVNLQKLGIDINRNYTDREKELIKQNINDISNFYDMLYFFINNFK